MAQQKTTRNIEILQGATFKMTLTYKNSQGTSLINSGDTARMQIRSEKSQTASLLLDCATYLTISTAAIVVEIPASVTAGLSFAQGFYDVELVQGGTVRRLAQGAVSLDTGVTV